MDELKPCPFCGDTPFMKSYDRLIKIGCKRCGYDRTWYGLLTMVPHDVIVSPPGSKVIEYYNPNADKEAIEAWNRRATDGT